MTRTSLKASKIYKAADYVRGGENSKCDEWLQTNRVELKAMTTPQFIRWLDRKMDGYGTLILPAEVLQAERNQCIEARGRTAVTERILREAGSAKRVAPM